jgi:hypothetical protein
MGTPKYNVDFNSLVTVDGSEPVTVDDLIKTNQDYEFSVFDFATIIELLHDLGEKGEWKYGGGATGICVVKLANGDLT